MESIDRLRTDMDGKFTSIQTQLTAVLAELSGMRSDAKHAAESALNVNGRLDKGDDRHEKFAKAMDERFEKAAKDLAERDTRIGKLEGFRIWLFGAAAGIGLVTGGAGYKIFKVMEASPDAAAQHERR